MATTKPIEERAQAGLREEPRTAAASDGVVLVGGGTATDASLAQRRRAAALASLDRNKDALALLSKA